MVLDNVLGQARRVLALTGMDRVFDVGNTHPKGRSLVCGDLSAYAVRLSARAGWFGVRFMSCRVVSAPAARSRCCSICTRRPFFLYLDERVITEVHHSAGHLDSAECFERISSV